MGGLRKLMSATVTPAQLSDFLWAVVIWGLIAAVPAILLYELVV
jgi:hypothetical protein